MYEEKLGAKYWTVWDSVICSASFWRGILIGMGGGFNFYFLPSII
jgi:hypothetical protein